MTSILRQRLGLLAACLLVCMACAGNSASDDLTALDTGHDAARDADSADVMPDATFSDLVDALDLPDLAPESEGLTPDVDVQPPDSEADATDCAPGMGGFGCPCAADGDCLAGFCVWAGDARVCTRDCNDDCPTGWTCAAVQLPDTVYLCVSLSATLCRPCATAADCAGEWGAAAPCLDFGAAEGSFCGGACEGEAEACPTGHHCADATTVEGVSLRQCLPDGGECACSARSVELGLSTPCHVANPFGSCPGVRSCTPGGLTDCGATPAAEEICGDGVDQDCDGVADDGFPDTDGDDELDCVDLDDDDDGEKDTTDCAPLDPLVNHAAAEVCNGVDPATGLGIDDDCDGQIDADDPDLGAQPRPPCEKQAGLCAGSEKPLALCSLGQWQPCSDATYLAFSSAYAPGDASCNGVDNDCDDLTDEGFEQTVSSCGTGACVATGTRACADGDEVDSCVAGSPGFEDCDFVDDDCDGQTDEGYQDCDDDGHAECLDLDADADCVDAATDCDDFNPAVNPFALEVCNGIDDNCREGIDEENALQCQVYYRDADGDGYGTEENKCLCQPTGEFTANEKGDCNDQAAGIHPGVGDATCNAIDDDCDGLNDQDFLVTATACGLGACAAVGQKVCTGGAVVDTCTSGTPTGEVCNQQDDDCDGKTDAADPTDLLAHDAEGCANQAGVCGGSTTPVSYCVNGAWAACDKLVYAAWSTDFETPIETTCDGLDNDCNGQVDENGDAFCDDGNVCTFDACSSLGACGHVNDDDAFCPGGYCQDGICNAFVCQPEQPACDGDVARTCSERGDGYLPGGLDCAIVDKTCRDGECVERCGALRFDGLGDYVEGPAGSNFAPDTITVEAWVNVTMLSTDRVTDTVVATSADGTQQGFVLRVGNGIPSFAVGYGSAYYEAVSSQTITANTWVHVAGQYDGQNVRIYVNGQLGAATAGVGKLSAPTEPLRIGGRNPTLGRFLDGLIDEVRISNTIRYTASFTPAKVLTSDANTLLLYRFSETSGIVADDQSANGFDGTILGASHVQESPLCHATNTCGNGIREGSEECDDGNAVSWDGCTGCEIGEFLVNEYTASYQGNARVATFADGRFAVTWQAGEGSGWGIGAQRFDQTGRREGSLFQVNSYTTGDQTNPAITAQSDGRFVVTWMSAGQDGSDLGIYAQQFTAAGTKAGGEFRVNSTTSWSQSYPSIVALPTDRLVTAWQSFVTASEVDIRAQLWSAGAVKDGGEVAVNATTTGTQAGVDLAALTDGRFASVWTDWGGKDGSGWGIVAQVFQADGTKSGSEFVANTFTTGDQSWGVVAPSANGGYVISWYATCGSLCSNRPDTSGNAIYAQRFDSNGVKVGGEILVNSYTTDNQESARIGGYGDGRFVVTWTSNGQDGAALGVYGQRFTADGAKAGGEFRVNRYTTSEQKIGAVRTFADGRFVVVYESYGQDGSDWGIYARLYDADGQALLPGDTDRDGMPDGVDLDDDGDGSADNLDCAPKDAAAHPGAVEVCDAKDNDCDGATDEGLTVAPPDAACPTAGVCAGHSLVAVCTAGAWVCDTSGVTHHEATETTCDGLDNDCDGTADENGVALCDDGNACTDDACQADAGCGHINNQAQCGAGYCDGGACHAWVCTPSQPACDGAIARTCNAAGSGFLAGGTNCSTASQTCANGTCIAPCRSLAFDGAAGYVQGPAGNLFTPAALTVEAWVRADSFGSSSLDNEIVGTADWSDGTLPSRGFVLRLWKGVPTFFIGNGPTWYQALSTEPIGTGAWVHLAGQYDGQNVTLFVNGKKTATRAITGSIYPPTLPLRVGAGSMGGNYFDGLIDEVRLSNTIRYTADFEPIEVLPSDAHTLLLYHFGEASGTTTTDASGHGYDALLYGTAWSADSPACATAVCVPGAVDCNGSVMRECGVLGDGWMDLHDCAASGQTCAAGACVGTATCCTASNCMAPQSCVADANAGSCGLHSEAFTYTTTGFDGTYWAANGSVYHSSSGYVSLTTASGQGGSLWYKSPVSFCGLKVDFSYYVTASSMIADGFALVLQNGTETAALGLPGGNLGAGNLSGISVRFQFFNKAWYPVRVFHDPDNAVICTGNALPGAGGTYALHVESVAGRIKVVSNGTTYLDCDVSTYLPKNGGLVGWTAATGAFGSTQRLTNTVIAGPCSGKPGGVCQ